MGLEDQPAARPVLTAGETKRLFWGVFPATMVPSFLAIADATIVASALPAIAATTGDVEHISWIVVSYLLAVMVAAPVYGFFGDVFGRRTTLLVALVLFIVASVLCAVSTTTFALTAARTLQGLGGGGLMTLSQALVGEVIPPRERPRYQGYFATVGVAAQGFGALAGGVLTQAFGWPSIFLVNVPIGVLAIVLVWRLNARPAVPRGAWRFDGFGLTLFTLVLVPLLVALERGQRLDPGALPAVIGSVLVSGVALAVLIPYERRHASPILPLDLFRERPFWLAALMAGCHGAALVSVLTYLPLSLRVLRNASASDVGFYLVPVTVGFAIGGIIFGQLVSRTERTMVFPTVSLALSTVVLLTFALLGSRLSAVETSALLTLNSILMGSTMTTVQVTMQSVAGHARLARASAALQISRAVGSALGTALSGAVLFATLIVIDPSLAAIFADVVDHGPGLLDTVTADRRAVVMGAADAAFRGAFVVPALFTALGAVCAFFNPSRRL